MTETLHVLRTGGPDPQRESQALGEWLLAAAGVERPAGLITVAPSADARRVPWGRRADWMIVPAGEDLALMPLDSAAVHPGENLAGEERDAVVLKDGEPAARLALGPEVALLRGALVRCVLMAGALERILELSLTHARQRRQFGRAIGSFQAVQAHLVTIAQQAALVSVAVQAALSREGAFEIAAAKLLAGEAGLVAGRAAHQVHGAVGVTQTHQLSVETRRLWAWRGEYGDRREWAGRLGDAVWGAGPDRLYPTITAGSRELAL